MDEQDPLLLTIFMAIEDSAVGSVIAQSLWAFPVIEAVHLLGLCLLGGAIFVVDLRLLGVTMTEQRISEIAEYAHPWLRRAVVVLIVTGVLLFSSEAVKCYYNTSFWVKMTTLPLALFFTFTVRKRLVSDPGLETSARSRMIGLASIALWFTVAAAGRWIGFS